ncbi:MAG: hypothetical protein ACRDI2_10975 [Chloroflexota bacterium]
MATDAIEGNYARPIELFQKMGGDGGAQSIVTKAMVKSIGNGEATVKDAMDEAHRLITTLHAE